MPPRASQIPLALCYPLLLCLAALSLLSEQVAYVLLRTELQVRVSAPRVAAALVAAALLRTELQVRAACFFSGEDG